MLNTLRQKLFLLCFLALVTQSGLAQSADYFLERVAIQAQLMQEKAPLPMTGDPLGQLTAKEAESKDPVTSFALDLSNLVSDLETWKSRLPANQRQTYEEVRLELDEHQRRLENSASLLSLSPEQSTHLNLLLLELEQAAQNIDSEYLRLAVDAERPRRRDRTLINVGVGSRWNAWGGPWGGWGAWGAGPYFGQPFGPGFGPGLGPRCW